jgi:glyoxylase-like metal-dependent hydrolase (beta-lactamase superfamily II)
MKQLAPGLHRWTARHPDWHPTGDGFGAEVASFALVASDDLLLVDPLVPDDEPTLLDALAGAAGNTYILITIGYHVRSAAALSARYDAPIHGPAQAGQRLASKTKAFTLLEPGTPGPAGVVAHAIGRPRRGETPLWLPSHHAIAFGDALVTTPEGDLRMWCQEPVDDRRRAFYRDRFAPTLDPLIAREPARILVTHGAPVLAGGAGALRDAVAAGPWYHRG